MLAKSFNCKYHPDETVERVSLSASAPKPLYCLECVLEVTDDSIKPTIVKLSQFIAKVKDQHALVGKPYKIDGQPPNSFLQVMDKQNEALAKLGDSIEGQKYQVESYFSKLLESLTTLLEDEKRKHLVELDNQLNQLKLNFDKYHSTICKHFDYGDQSFANGPDYEGIISSCSSIDELEMAVKKIVGDLEEAKVANVGQTDEIAVLNKIKLNKEYLEKIITESPKFSHGTDSSDVSEITTKIQDVLGNVQIENKIELFSDVKPIGKMLTGTEFMHVRTNCKDIKDLDKLKPTFKDLKDDYDLTDRLMDGIEIYETLMFIETDQKEKIVMYMGKTDYVIFKPGGKVFKGKISLELSAKMKVNDVIAINADNCKTNMSSHWLDGTKKDFKVKDAEVYKLSNMSLTRPLVDKYSDGSYTNSITSLEEAKPVKSKTKQKSNLSASSGTYETEESVDADEAPKKKSMKKPSLLKRKSSLKKDD